MTLPMTDEETDNRPSVTATTPTVSVAMATYNGATYLAEQLDSLSSQTFRDFEIVIFDDCSADNTLDIVAEYATRAGNVRFKRNPVRKGYIKNFETAIKACRGQIILLCDQDDIWEPSKIARHVEAYRDPSVAWVANRVYLIDKDGAPRGLLEDMEPDYYAPRTLAEAAWGRCIIGCATSFRADLLRKFIPIGDSAKAHDSWFQLMFRGTQRILIEDRLQAYRIHGSNTAAMKRHETFDQKRKAWRDHRQLLRELVLERRAPAALRLQCALLYARAEVAALLKGR